MATCEDFPACGHEQNDCDGSLYGTDEQIKEQVRDQWVLGHGYCDHAEGIFVCEVQDDDEDEDEWEDEDV